VASEEIWMDLRALHRHGWSISALAREFHVNRRTVSRELEAVEPRRYSDRAAKHPPDAGPAGPHRAPAGSLPAAAGH
jgi:IS30 family transposase